MEYNGYENTWQTEKIEKLVELSFKPELVLSEKAMTKIRSYTKAVNSEIGGLMIVKSVRETPTVTDVVLLKQEVSAASVEIDSDKLIKYISVLSQKNPKLIESISGWWHSHNDFDAFWSGVDDACFECFLNIMPLAYGIVTNKNGKMLARVDAKTPLGTIKINNLTLNTVGKIDQKYIAEAKRKAKQQSFYPMQYEYGGYGSEYSGRAPSLTKEEIEEIAKFNRKKQKGLWQGYDDCYGGFDGERP